MFRGKFFVVADGQRLGVVGLTRTSDGRRFTVVQPVALPLAAATPTSESFSTASNLTHPQQAALTAAQSLLTRCGVDFELHAWMTREPSLFGMSLPAPRGRQEDLPVLAIPNVSPPPDLLEAETAWRTYLAQAAATAPTSPSSDVGSTFALLDPTQASEWHELTRRKSLLVHVCCGPDAGGVLQQLKPDYDLTAFWYDPNIQPKAEHDLRLEAFLKVCEIEGVRAVVGEYDVDNFLGRIGGFEHTPEQGAKCSICYDLRLERAAVEAKTQGCDRYTTTLAISPHKVQTKLASFGGLYAQKYGVPYLAKNFMKEDGFKDSVEYTREHDIYRQDYCGCWFSLYEGGPRAQGQAALLELGADQLKITAQQPNSALEARYDALAEAGAFDSLPSLGSPASDRSFG